MCYICSTGKIGWEAKGVVYAILGGLCCKMGSNGQLADTSPQVSRLRLFVPSGH